MSRYLTKSGCSSRPLSQQRNQVRKDVAIEVAFDAMIDALSGATPTLFSSCNDLFESSNNGNTKIASGYLGTLQGILVAVGRARLVSPSYPYDFAVFLLFARF